MPKKNTRRGSGIARRKSTVTNRTIQTSTPPASAEIPVTYQAIQDFFQRAGQAKPFILRLETIRQIEVLTKRPLVCYVTKTNNAPQGLPTYVDNADLTGFDDLTQSIVEKGIDVFIVSNGGSAEAAERIVRLLRERFDSVRFIVPGNAYSAATLMCFSGDEVIMGARGTLGPIDPQINGIPTRTILRAFETLEQRLKDEGPRALTAYMPLISKYDLHMLEMCKSYEELSRELATMWLSQYMLKCPRDDKQVKDIVDFFADYDTHKSHGRSIGITQARELKLEVADTQETPGLRDLVCSLYNQYEMWFDTTSFFKMFENAHGINWGRQAKTINVQLPTIMPPGNPQPAPQPGAPQPSQQVRT